MSRLQKGIAALAVALVAVIGLGYGGLIYLESGVVDAIRQGAKQTPPDIKIELGDVQYSLINNRLHVTNIRAEYLLMGRKTTTTIGSLEILNPDADFMQAVVNPEKPLKQPVVPVADKVSFQNARTGPDPEWTVASGSYTNIKLDLAKARELIQSGLDAQKFPQLVALASYATAESNDLTITLKEDSPVGVPFQLSVKSAKMRDYNKGGLASAVISDLRYKTGDVEAISLAEMTMEGITPPPDALIEKLNGLSEDSDPAEALALLGQVFAGPEPLLKKLELKDFKSLIPTAPASCVRIAFTNPTTSPYTCSLDIQNLILPTSGDVLQIFQMLALKNIDLSTAFSLTAQDKNGDFKTALSLNLANLGDADFRLEGVLPPEFGKTMLAMFADAYSDEQLLVTLEGLKCGRLELRYKDTGLLSRVASLTQAMFGMTTQQSLASIRDYLEKSMLQESNTPEVNAAYVTKILSALEKPGTIRLVFATPEPMTMEAIEKLPIPSPYETLEATPGPKTLEEQVKELKR